MILKKYDDLPNYMKNSEVEKYYNIIKSKKLQLLLKRVFDIVVSIIGTIILMPIMVILAIIIKIESKGPALFKQVRVTQYGREFKIFKFRTMVVNAESLGSQVTTNNDPRVTKVGKVIRKYRLDELPQIINVLKGDLSFVGTRPEVPKYVNKYNEEMLATLLLPAGITSDASIEFKDEEKILNNSSNVDSDYIKKVLPLKMEYNLKYTRKFSFIYDIKVMFKTFFAVIGLNTDK